MSLLNMLDSLNPQTPPEPVGARLIPLCGESNNVTKDRQRLNAEDVAQIKAMLRVGGRGNQKRIADLFHITPGTVSDIKREKYWGHIK